ncbi:hypothetical protein T06_16952 [Trichinella sp. T6]|nr:hypothetical protein T06_16952 [Trichinella sp. T6]
MTLRNEPRSHHFTTFLFPVLHTLLILLCLMAADSHLVRSGCRDTVYTSLEVNTVLRTTPHAETCTADDSILYKIEKKNTLKRHANEETKPVPQIYREECSSAYTSLETAGHFPTHKKKKICGNWLHIPSGTEMENLKLFLNGLPFKRNLSFATLRLPLSLQCRDRFRESKSKAATFISANKFCGGGRSWIAVIAD